MSIFSRLFSSPPPPGSPDLKAGDVFYPLYDGQYHTYKVLDYDDATETYHVLMYAPSAKAPDADTIDTMSILAYHAPIAKDGFKGTTLLTQRPVRAADLLGYHEYLRQTSSEEEFLQVANGYYQMAYKLTDDKKYMAAIDYYSRAIDLAPHFYQAIDNRAFCKMDLGLWQEAILDFELSLTVHPDSLLAEFSLGECYLNLKDYPKAKERFEKALTIDPSHQASNAFLKRTNDLIAAG
jgi:tetratricopeptide (TPR) repeat protein